MGRVARRRDGRGRRRLPVAAALTEADIQPDLDRRAPGQSNLVTQRKESDTVRILSGVFEGKTLGTPISLSIANEDQRSGDYREVATKYRPSHADYTYDAKYGIATSAAAGGRARGRRRAAWPPGRSRGSCSPRDSRGDRRVGLEGRARVGRLRRRDRHARGRRADAHPLPRSRDRGGDDRDRPEGAQGRQLGRRRRHLRGARLSARLGRAGVRSPRGRSRQGDDEPPREQGLRDRLGLRRHRPHRPRAQRRVLHGRRTRPHAHQPQRRRAGRHHQRRDDLLPHRLQADGDGHARAADRDSATAEDTTIQGRGRHDPCVLPRAVPIVEAMAALVLADHALRYEAVAPRR